MLLELHLLQNFAPSNLNRDDTGSPKDCQFGGFTRARISSQCLKRAIRTEFNDRHLIPPTDLATRTKRIVEALADQLGRGGKPSAQAIQVATALLNSLKFSVDPKNHTTQYLLFVSQDEINTAAHVCEEYWDDLLAAAEAGPTGPKANAAVPPEAVSRVIAAFNGHRAADLALFGRMIADRPDFSLEGAAQVAHAISTHQVSTNFDFYTAIDDLKPKHLAGADMLGVVEFNSACFYRYANVDAATLMANLSGDRQLAERTVLAFIQASVDAIPTGRQHSTAAYNAPSLVMAVVREYGAWNLANAFLRPVRPRQDLDLVHVSIRQLDEYWTKLVAMYGQGAIRWVGVASLEPDQLSTLASYHVIADGEHSQIAMLANQATAMTFA